MEFMKKVWKVAKVIFAIGSFIWAIGKTSEAKKWKEEWEKAVSERARAFAALRWIEWDLMPDHCCDDIRLDLIKTNVIE